MDPQPACPRIKLSGDTTGPSKAASPPEAFSTSGLKKEANVKLEWMNHTGFVVSDMERSLAFYRDVLGLREEINLIREGDAISQIVGYPNARLHVIYLGTGDLKHSVELIQYLNPPGGKIAPTNRNDVGSSHLGIVVDDLDAIYEELSAKGVQFLGPPVSRPDTIYGRKVCYLQDPDGNWLEMLEGSPILRFA